MGCLVWTTLTRSLHIISKDWVTPKGKFYFSGSFPMVHHSTYSNPLPADGDPGILLDILVMLECLNHSAPSTSLPGKYFVPLKHYPSCVTHDAEYSSQTIRILFKQPCGLLRCSLKNFKCTARFFFLSFFFWRAVQLSSWCSSLDTLPVHWVLYGRFMSR